MEAARISDVPTLETRLREDSSFAVAVDEVRVQSVEINQEIGRGLVEICCQGGETALHKAAKRGNVSVAEKLIQVNKACLDIPSRKVIMAWGRGVQLQARPPHIPPKTALL